MKKNMGIAIITSALKLMGQRRVKTLCENPEYKRVITGSACGLQPLLCIFLDSSLDVEGRNLACFSAQPGKQQRIISFSHDGVDEEIFFPYLFRAGSAGI